MVDLNNIYIIGAGAIGKALAILLQRAGKKVTLIRGSVDDGQMSVQHLTLDIHNQQISEDVPVVALRTLNKLDGLIVITIKSFGNEALAHSLRPKAGNAPIVLLQNGLAIETPFQRLQYPQIYRCVLFVTSQALEDRIRFKPVAPCPIGVVQGDESLLPPITHALTTSDFSFVPDLNIKQTVWRKAIINTVFNSICPLLEIDNGVFHREGTAMHMARRIISACIPVAAADGVQLQAQDVEASLIRISIASGQQWISTLQDIRQGRHTEIDTLNFAVTNLADKHNLSDNVREVLLLGQLTRLKADLHEHARTTEIL